MLVGTIDTSTNDNNCHRRPMAIIFIDEIDCMAKRRDSGIGYPSSIDGGRDEREQTLNQLLTEIYGFEMGNVSSIGVDVIVISATNRLEVLDPAIMRPGRFDGSRTVQHCMEDLEFQGELHDQAGVVK